MNDIMKRFKNAVNDSQKRTLEQRNKDNFDWEQQQLGPQEDLYRKFREETGEDAEYVVEQAMWNDGYYSDE